MTETLTKRHKEVIALAIEGKSNSQIANELEISINTAKGHMRAIFNITGCNNRIELMHKFMVSSKSSDSVVRGNDFRKKLEALIKEAKSEMNLSDHTISCTMFEYVLKHHEMSTPYYNLENN